MGPPASIGNNLTPGPSVIVEDISTMGPCAIQYTSHPFPLVRCGVRRASQAKQFKATQGHWLEKSVKFITRLLKNAESNADAKSLELEDLYIKNIGIQQAPVLVHASRSNLFSCIVILLTPHRKPVTGFGEEVERSKDKDKDAAGVSSLVVIEPETGCQNEN
ncbi:hypothetical protein EV702DRAFT_1051385 [Suillus placidus]|uniref:Uncharacterized protein n=1 Tax=Suillus placidus TaxID=48579 RepID=A0A9P7CV23_9AGAM|nr:hypothetical protein EV702DRAFT_1051385 [Suillus placidus]